MKPLIVLGILAAASHIRAEVDIIPQPFGKDRYAETIAKSPFVLETKVVEEPVVKKEDPFANLYLRGISGSDGKEEVIIQRLGEDKAMRLVGNEPSPDGIFVKSVKSGGTFREAVVVVQKGTETGEIKFKEEAIAATPVAQPRPPGANGPGMPQFTRPGVPQIPGTIPGSVRTVPSISNAPIPRPQTPTSIPLPKAPTNVPLPTSNSPGRTRTRTIGN